jgi:hypothetical protein
MTEGMSQGPNGRGNGRLEAAQARPSYSLPTWFPEDSGREPEASAASHDTHWHPPSEQVPLRLRPLRAYGEETGEDFEPRRRLRPPPQRRAPAMHHIARAAAAGMLSVLIGALSALVVYDITSGGSVRATLSSVFFGTPLPAGGASSSNTTTIGKKVVVTARVDALDVAGSADMPIPLSLKAEAGDPDQAIALKLSGLPRDAYLTAGSKLGANDWLLKPGQELGVKIVVPSPPPVPLSLAVAAIEPASGELVAPVREFKVAVAPTVEAPAVPRPELIEPKSEQIVAKQEVIVEPAHAPAEGRTDLAARPEPVVEEAAVVPVAVETPAPAATETQPAAAPIPEPIGEAAALMARGDALMKAGEFVAARAFYGRALKQGAPQAAFKMAQTFDPEVFVQHQVRGLRPDPAQALDYYKQAASGGIVEAQAAIGRLASQ